MCQIKSKEVMYLKIYRNQEKKVLDNNALKIIKKVNVKRVND